MTRRILPTLAVLLACLGLVAAACSNDDPTPTPAPDAASDGASPPPNDDAADAADGGGPGDTAPAGGVTLKAFTPPPANPGAKAVLFAASGEVLAFTGYDFPPASQDDAAFVDGWEIKFSRLLVTVDKITLSSNPDMVPTDQSVTGSLVAEVDGPWAIDLHKDDPSYLMGKGGADERAVPIAALTRQNKNGDQAFDTAGGTRYGFGFDLVPATANAINVNLGPEALADYAQMVANRCAVLYVGTATFKGQTCTPSDPAFDKLPKTVSFNLCFKSPTSYLNCQNPDNDPAAPFANEEHQRGIAFKDNTFTIAQVTVHTDHPFWESTVHDSPAHFDQFAARARPGVAGAPAMVTMDDVVGVDFQAITDRDNVKLPWRSCLTGYTPPQAGTQAGNQVHFDPQSVPAVGVGGDASKGLRDYADFATYNQSTQGHLNSDGLCYVRRNYPSPQ